MWYLFFSFGDSLVAQRLKHLPGMLDTRVRSLGQEDPLEKEMATHSSTLAWRIPWRGEPGRLQSMGSQRAGHHWVNSLHFTSLKVLIFRSFPGGSEVKAFACNVGDQGSILGLGRFPWRRKWQLSTVFLPGESHGGRWATVHGVTKSRTWLSDFT